MAAPRWLAGSDVNPGRHDGVPGTHERIICLPRAISRTWAAACGAYSAGCAGALRGRRHAATAPRRRPATNTPLAQHRHRRQGAGYCRRAGMRWSRTALQPSRCRRSKPDAQGRDMLGSIFHNGQNRGRLRCRPPGSPIQGNSTAQSGKSAPPSKFDDFSPSHTRSRDSAGLEIVCGPLGQPLASEHAGARRGYRQL